MSQRLTISRIRVSAERYAGRHLPLGAKKLTLALRVLLINHLMIIFFLSIALLAGRLLLTAGLPRANAADHNPGGGRFTWQVLGPAAIANAHSCDNAFETELLAAGKMQAFAIDLADPTVMYAGGGIGPGNSGPYSDAGIYKSTDGGSRWREVDKGLTDAHIDSLWLNQAKPSIVVATTWFGGIFRTTNAGSSWSNVYSSRATSLVQVGNLLYAGTANGVAESSDVGRTWAIVESTANPVRALGYGHGALYAGLDDGTVLTRRSSSSPWTTIRSSGPPNTTVWDIAVNPSDGREAIVVLNYDGNLENIVTTDGGQSWSSWPASLPTGSCAGGIAAQVVAFDTVNPDVLYADFGGALFVSGDRGASWTLKHMYEDLRLIEPLPGESGAVVVGGDQGIYMSTDTGSTWTSLNGNLTTNLLNGLAVSGSTILTTAQDFSPIQSFDGGTTWQQLSGSAPPVGENGSAAINPLNTNYQYVFTTSGFQYSTDGGRTFQASSGLPNSEFTYNGNDDVIAVDETNPGIIYAAAKDGVYESTDWGATWSLTSWRFSNPTLVVVDPNGVIYVGTTAGQLSVSRDHGTTWTSSTLPFNSGAFPTTLSVNPSNTEIVLVGTNQLPTQTGGGVWMSTDGGNSFTTDNGGLESYPLPDSSIFRYYAWSVRFAPSSRPNVAALATSDGIYVSAAGGSWTTITANAVPQVYTQVVWDSGYLYASSYGEGVLRVADSRLSSKQQ